MTRVNIEQLMTPPEAAKFHGVTRQAIYRLISAGILESVEIGGRIFLRRADVEAYQPSNPGGRPSKSKSPSVQKNVGSVRRRKTGDAGKS